MSDYSKYLKNINLGDKEVESVESSSMKETSDEEQNNSQVKTKLSSIFNKVKGYVKLSSSETEQERAQRENSTLYKVSQCCGIEKNFKAFLIFLTLGIGITFFSFMFLPMAILAPKKFVSLFSLGCSTLIFSFMFYYGAYDFLSILFNPERKVYTILYFASTILGLYFSFFLKSYFILSLLCTIVQFITVAIFTLSFIPGGKTGINFILGLILAPIKKIFNSNS
ncbi:MAG: Got1/Sft2-like family vesicle transport protein [archaeon]|nr:Got1/Sft2-like family vesicle transport protein [archaeon]